MVLGFYTHELSKNAKNRIVISFLSQTLCETVVGGGESGKGASCKFKIVTGLRNLPTDMTSFRRGLAIVENDRVGKRENSS